MKHFIQSESQCHKEQRTIHFDVNYVSQLQITQRTKSKFTSRTAVIITERNLDNSRQNMREKE